MNGACLPETVSGRESTRELTPVTTSDSQFGQPHCGSDDAAEEVVGVGSVGTICTVILLAATDDDPIFLQAKEARVSVLEPYACRSEFENRGQRVVVGQRIMQSASDIFLGWVTDKQDRHFYLRQLRDGKIKPMVEMSGASLLIEFAKACGWTLARPRLLGAIRRAGGLHGERKRNHVR